MFEWPIGATDEAIVIINVATEMAATLALASVNRLDSPVVLLNCAPTELSRSYFAILRNKLAFHLVEVPLRSHGETLDSIFANVPADSVLLVDSDAEVRDPSLIRQMRAHLRAADGVFGSGFINSAGWLEPPEVGSSRFGYYQERAWMPCVLFRSRHVRSALEHGRSFKSYMKFNEFRFSERLSRFFGRRIQDAYSPRSRLVASLPGSVQDRLRRTRLDRLSWMRGDYNGARPHYVVFDTGADVYQWCKYDQELIFAGLDWRLLDDEVAHYQGMTRRLLKPETRNATTASTVEGQITARLSDVYELDWATLVGEASVRVAGAT